MKRLSPSCRDERGAFLVLWALLIVALMIMVAIVIDLGQLRFNRQDDQRIADLAATAAGARLASGGVNASGGFDPDAGCLAALDYVKENAPGFPSTATMASVSTGCPHLDFACDNASAERSATVDPPGASPWALTVTYPVSDASITDSVNGGVTTRDGSQCERMKITVTKSNDSYFGGVLGVDDQTISASSVVRLFASSTKSQVAALLLLERFECQALWRSGQGNVLVKAFRFTSGPNVGQIDPDHPGRIHTDSFGTSGCSGSNASAHRVYGITIPSGSGSSRPGAPSILAEGTGDACPGTNPSIGRGFLTLPVLGGNAAADVDTGVCPGPNIGTVSSRARADRRYNGYVLSTGATDTSDWINDLRSTARTQTAINPASLPVGYRLFPDSYAADGITSCSPNVAVPVGLATDRVFVNCDLTPQNLVLRGQEIIVNGKINIANNVLRFPDVQELYVRGCGTTTASGTVSGCNGGNVEGFSINGGTFSMHDGVTALDGTLAGGAAYTSCTANSDIDSGLTSTTTSRFVILTGKFFVNNQASRVRMCQTTLYMAEKPSDATSKSLSGGSGPSACNFLQPCPTTVNSNSFIETAGSLDWTAPNLARNIGACETAASTGCYPWEDGDTAGTLSFADYKFEDLAFWTEAGGSGTSTSSTASSEIGGQGFTAIAGVFFLPNGLFTFQGQTSIAQDLNAQFIARRLNLSGQGDLNMIPNPNDAITVPVLNYDLIR